MEDITPIVFVSDDCNAIDQSFNVAGTKLNVEGDVSNLISLLVKSLNAFLLLIMIMIQYCSSIHPLPAQQTVLC